MSLEEEVAEVAKSNVVKRRKNGQPEVMLPDHARKAQEAAITKGMEELQALYTERDLLKRRIEDLIMENQRLNLELEQAVERERIRVQRVMDEAVTEGRKAKAEMEVMQAASLDLHARLYNAQAATEAVRQEVATLKAAMAIIKTALERTLDEPIQEKTPIKQD